MDRFDLLGPLESNASPRLYMGFHSIVCCRASQVEKVVGCAKIEFKCRVPISSQFGLRCLGIYGLKIDLRDKSRRSFVTAEPLDPFLHSFSCPGVKRDRDRNSDQAK